MMKFEKKAVIMYYVLKRIIKNKNYIDLIKGVKN